MGIPAWAGEAGAGTSVQQVQAPEKSTSPPKRWPLESVCKPQRIGYIAANPYPPTTMESHIASITHAIQLAVAPVFLLTAIATLINVMSGRLSRIVDRRRVLHNRLQQAGDGTDEDREELIILDDRSRLVYFSILFAVFSALLVCLVVASAFFDALVAIDVARVVATLFILAMTSMILALTLFLREIYLAVRAGSHRRR